MSYMPDDIPADIISTAEKAYLDWDPELESTPTVIARAILAERERHGWQTIDTAPKDGESVIAAFYLWNDPSEGYAFEVACWDGEEWVNDGDPIHPPTHWMPLPSPPKP